MQESNNVFDFILKRDIVRYLYHAAGSPVPSTWTTAINNNKYATWPGLIAQKVRKHLPKSVYTVKGHMRQIRKNQRSTKKEETKVTSPDTPSCEMMTTSNDNV